MIEKSQFQTLLLNLSHWFQSHSRQLPWRDAPTPYNVWVSEIMLQQTQVATVVDYFNRFTAHFPTLESLSKSSVEEVMANWSGLGYYSRARNLHKTANLLGDDLPSSRKELEALPGIGPYTAGAILSIAFNQYEAILDGNLERIFARMLQIPRNAHFKRRLWKISWLFIHMAKELQLDPSVINQALMEIGALICRPSSPLCGECPFQPKCRSFRFKTQGNFPQKGSAKVFVNIEEMCYFIIDSQGRFLLERDEKVRWRRGTWDLPKNLPKGIVTEKRGEVGDIRLTVTHHKINRVVECHQYRGGDCLPVEFIERMWVVDERDEKLPIASPLIKSLKKIRSL